MLPWITGTKLGSFRVWECWLLVLVYRKWSLHSCLSLIGECVMSAPCSCVSSVWVVQSLLVRPSSVSSVWASDLNASEPPSTPKHPMCAVSSETVAVARLNIFSHSHRYLFVIFFYRGKRTDFTLSHLSLTELVFIEVLKWGRYWRRLKKIH